MASDKKPSIYSDRGSIGSAEELDEYGVWVKSEPQVLSADSDSGISSDLDDFVLPVEDSSADDDSLSFDDAILDVDEARKPSLSENIEFPDDSVDLDLNDDPLSSTADLADFNMPADDDTGFVATESSDLDIEDTSFDEFEVPSDSSDDVAAEDEIIEAGNDDFDEEDFISEEFNSEEFNNDEFNSDISDSNGFGDIDLDIPTVKSIENNINAVQDDFETVQTGEGELSTHLLKKIASELSSIRSELTDLKKEFASARSFTSEDGKRDDSTGFFSGEDDETIALTGDELDNILTDSSEFGEEEAPKSGFDIGDDDEDEAIALTGDELDNILNSADFTEESGTEESPESEFTIDDDSSSDILEADIFGSAPAEAEAETDDITEDDFIDIDDDLDIDLDPNMVLDENDVTDIADDTISDDTIIDDIAEEEKEIDDITSGFDGADLVTDDFADFAESDDTDIEELADDDELNKLREEGATPVSDVPDNVSYLEDDDEDSESFDLSDAVIDEPDLSADGISDELSEPSLDDDDFDLNSFDDLSLDDSDEPMNDVEIADPLEDLQEESFDEPIEQVIPEALVEEIEEEIEDEPIPFDNDLEDLSGDDFDDVLEMEPEEEEVQVSRPAPAKQPAPAQPAPAQSFQQPAYAPAQQTSFQEPAFAPPPAQPAPPAFAQ